LAIYSNYYRCARDPFSLSPDPDFLFLSESHREGLAQMRYAIESRRGFAVLTGEAGTGKSTLIRSVLQSVDENCPTGYIFNPPCSLRELYAMIDSELDIGLTNSENPIGRFNDYLLQVFRAGGTVALIIDEAQVLSREILEAVRLLTNLETSTAKLLQIVLAGQPEFDAILDSEAQRALRQRVALRHRLSRLSHGDTQRYIALRLELACGNAELFSRDACAAVHFYSGGIPRLINLICDTAMLAGYVEGSPGIVKSQVESAAEDLRLRDSPVVVLEDAPADRIISNQPWRAVTMIVAVLLGLSLLISTRMPQMQEASARLFDNSMLFIERMLGKNRVDLTLRSSAWPGSTRGENGLPKEPAR
jgi:general secretion pathway protein A